MSQFSAPGIMKANVGLDYTETKGLLVGPSGGNPNKAVNQQELSTAASGLQTQINNLRQNVKSNIPVTARFLNGKSALTGSMVHWTQGTDSVSPFVTVALNPGHAANSMFNQNIGVKIRIATTGLSDDYIRSQAQDYLILIEEGGPIDPSATGFYYLRQVNTAVEPFTLVHATFLNNELVETPGNLSARDGVGTVIFVDQGDYENSFFTIPVSVNSSPGMGQNYSTGSNVNTPLPAPYTSSPVPQITIAPWGRLQDLQTDPLSFLQIVGNQISGQIETDHFQVVAGKLDLSNAFAALLDNFAQGIAALNGLVSQLEGDVATNTTAIANILNNIIPTLAPKNDMIATMGNWYSSLHIIRSLTGGVFDSVAEKTTFTIELPSYAAGAINTIDWAIVRLSEAAAPYTVVSDPVILYDNASNPRAAIIEFYASAQVPDGLIEAFLMPFFRNPAESVPVYVVASGS
jgi:hypothetical protein